MVAHVAGHFPDLDIAVGTPDPREANLLINATPIGLHPETDPTLIDPRSLRPDMIVADIVMKPRETKLLQAAREAGCDIRYGAGMLDCQIDLMMRHFGY